MKKITAFVFFLAIIFAGFASPAEECALRPVIRSADIYIPIEQYQNHEKVSLSDIACIHSQVSACADPNISNKERSPLAADIRQEEETCLMSNFMNAYIKTSNRL